VRIIIKCPESDSPRRGRIHLRGLSFRTSSNLLQFDGGAYIFANQLSATMRKFIRANQTSILSVVRLVGELLSSAGRIQR